VRSNANVRSNEAIREKSGSRNESRNNSKPLRNLNNPRTENSIRMNPNMVRSEDRPTKTPLLVGKHTFRQFQPDQCISAKPGATKRQQQYRARRQKIIFALYFFGLETLLAVFPFFMLSQIRAV
jgi:hypothetical protein